MTDPELDSREPADHEIPSLADPTAPMRVVTIFELRNPASDVPDGVRVAIVDPATSVTQSAGVFVWIQDAEPTGACVPAPELAYHGVVVLPATPELAVARGQRVMVEGTVSRLAGQTRIIDAVVSPVGAPAAEYRAHCELDGSVVATDAFEGMLVTTAGTTAGEAPPDKNGQWRIATCLSGEPPLLVDDLMYTHGAWSASEHRVTGIVMKRGVRHVLEPRDEFDIVPAVAGACD